ncbi:MAG: arginine--tRNA ligase [Candidatus Omnitrophota bacterium]
MTENIDIQKTVEGLILEEITSLEPGLEAPEIVFEFPKDSRFGDLAVNTAMQLSKKLRKPPMQIAGRLAEGIKRRVAALEAGNLIGDVRAEGAGFLNFYLSEEYFRRRLRSILETGRDVFRSRSGAGKRVLIEFVSANPTGSLSVAHARQAAVGDALANVFLMLGYDVSREYYLNDEGNQINILGKSIELRLKEINGEKVDFPDDHYQGEYICDIAREIKEKELHIEDYGRFGADHILAIIRKELDDFGVKFDCWYSQKDNCNEVRIKEALQQLRSRGYIYDDGGAAWFKSTAFGDDKDRVVVKSDGAYTYLAPDIAYHQDKYKRGYNLLVNLWGPDHHGYISRLKASVAASGYDPESLCVVIVQLATIFRNGQPVQMSTRKGQYITLREVLTEVGADAARFFFIMRKTSSHLDFDLEVAKRQTSENPVYYIQYAYARICGILKQAGAGVSLDTGHLGLLREKEELDLVKKLCQLNSVLEICALNRDPYLLTVYLQETAEAFHRFYDRQRVLGQEFKLLSARLCLLQAAGTVLALGLELLGIAHPEKM